MIFNVYNSIQIGHARVWIRDRVEDYVLIASPVFRLSHKSAVGMMEHGESLLSTFQGAKTRLDGAEVRLAPLAGTFMLPRNGEPVLADFVAVIPGKAEVRLSTLLTRGLGMLK